MRKRLLAIIVMLALLLGACGKQASEVSVLDTQPGDAATEEIRWMLEETKLPDGDEALADILPEGAGKPTLLLLGLSGSILYRVTEIHREELKITCIQRLESPYTQWESTVISDDEWVEGKSCYVSEVSLGVDDVQILLAEWGENGVESWYWVEWTKETGCRTELIESEHLGKDFCYDVVNFYKATDGTVFFTKAASTQYFDETFQKKKEWLDSGYVWQFAEVMGEEDAEAGKVYFCGGAIDNAFRIWTAENRDPVFSSDEVYMSFDGKVAFCNTSEGYLCTPQGIWQFSLDSSMDGGKLENLMQFEREGYQVERIYGASVNTSGNLFMAVLVDEEYLLLERKVDENWQAKIELELVTFWADAFLKKAVADFNRQSEKYYIVLTEWDGEENWLDFKTRIQVEIGSGGGPALVTDDIINVYDAAENGYLLNLTEELAEERRRMQENVWASGEVEGKCFAAPYSFCVDTLVVSADVAGEKEYWTTKEFMECVRSGSAEAAINRVDGAQLFWILLCQGKLIDWEKGKSYLDSKKVVELLEFAGKYGADDTPEDAYIRVVDGRSLAAGASIGSLDNFIGCVYEAMFQGKEVYIGYPTDSYPSQTGNLLRSSTLSVNQNCEYPEGAVAFIRYLLSQEIQKQLAKKASESLMYELPVDSEALEYAFCYAREIYENEEPHFAAMNGYEFMEGPVSEEAWAKLQKVILSASPQTVHAEAVETIVYEEVGAFFAGDRSAWEVCSIMQNRMQLYLDEIQ